MAEYLRQLFWVAGGQRCLQGNEVTGKWRWKSELGAKVRIERIVGRNSGKAVEDPSILTDSWEDIINDPRIQIIEPIGGTQKNVYFGGIKRGKACGDC